MPDLKESGYLQSARKYWGRSIRRTGDDGTTMQFSVASTSRLGVEHEISLERDSGLIYCSCEDAAGRKKIGDLLTGQGGCKHIRGFILLTENALRRHA